MYPLSCLHLLIAMLLMQILIKEEDRLATVISTISHDVSVVPRGALIRTPTGEVRHNRMFEGSTEYLTSSMYILLFIESI